MRLAHNTVRGGTQERRPRRISAILVAPIAAGLMFLAAYSHAAQTKVDRKHLTDAQVQTLYRNGKSLVIDLYEPSPRGKMPYLVAEIPKDDMDRLKAHVASRPKTERGKVVDDWIDKNHAAILKRYGNGKPSSFTISLASVSSKSRPRPIGPSPDVVNPYPAKPESPQEAKFPPKVKEGGNGNPRNPFVVELANEHSPLVLGTRYLNVPLKLDVKVVGTDSMEWVHFVFQLSPAQLAKSQRKKTALALQDIVNRGISYHGDFKGQNYTQSIRDQRVKKISDIWLGKVAEKVARKNPKLGEWLEKN